MLAVILYAAITPFIKSWVSIQTFQKRAILSFVSDPKINLQWGDFSCGNILKTKLMLRQLVHQGEEIFFFSFLHHTDPHKKKKNQQ